MELSNFPIDVIVFITSIIIGVFLGYVHAIRGKDNDPIWPVKLYLFMLKESNGTFRRNAAGRDSFKFREQFLAAAFVWFFILFVVSIIAFGGLRGY